MENPNLKWIWELGATPMTSEPSGGCLEGLASSQEKVGCCNSWVVPPWPRNPPDDLVIIGYLAFWPRPHCSWPRPNYCSFSYVYIYIHIHTIIPYSIFCSPTSEKSGHEQVVNTDIRSNDHDIDTRPRNPTLRPVTFSGLGKYDHDQSIWIMTWRVALKQKKYVS